MKTFALLTFAACLVVVLGLELNAQEVSSYGVWVLDRIEAHDDNDDPMQALGLMMLYKRELGSSEMILSEDSLVTTSQLRGRKSCAIEWRADHHFVHAAEGQPDREIHLFIDWLSTDQVVLSTADNSWLKYYRRKEVQNP